MQKVHYVLHVDERPVGMPYEDLETAKAEGLRQLKPGNSVHIESFAAPARSQAWRYDREVSAWVIEDL